MDYRDDRPAVHDNCLPRHTYLLLLYTIPILALRSPLVGVIYLNIRSVNRLIQGFSLLAPSRHLDVQLYIVNASHQAQHVALLTTILERLVSTDPVHSISCASTHTHQRINDTKHLPDLDCPLPPPAETSAF